MRAEGAVKLEIRDDGAGLPPTATYIIGAKTFTEQYILEALIEAAGSA